MNRTATGPNGQMVEIAPGQWVPVESSASGPEGAKKVQAGGAWYDVAPVGPALPEGNTQQTAFASARSGMLNPKINKEIEQTQADLDYGIRPGFSQEKSDALEEYRATEAGTAFPQAFFNEEDYANTLKQKHPGSELYRDQDGNTILDMGDGSEPQRINGDGFSAYDTMSLAGDMGSMFSFGNILKAKALLGKKAATWFEKISGKALGQGAGAAVYATGKDIAGNLSTGAEGLDVLPDMSRVASDAAMATGTQKLFGEILAPKAQAAWIARGNRKTAERAVSDAPPGQLADSARIAMQEAGIPTQGLSVDEINSINNALMEYPNLSGKELGHAIAVKGVAKVNPSVGTVSQDASHLYTENDMRTFKGSVADRANVTDQTVTKPNNYINKTVSDLDEPQPLAAAQETLAGQRRGQYEDFSGVPDDEGIPVGGRFQDARDQTQQYEMSPDQNQAIRNSAFEGVRNVEDYQVASDLMGYVPDVKAPEMGAIPNPPKHGKPPKRPTPARTKTPPASLMLKGKEDKLAAWRESNTNRARLEWNAKTDEHAIKMREYEAGVDAANAEYEATVRGMTAEHEAAAKLFETEPPVMERTGGQALSQATGTDKNITPADWLNWAERKSSDPKAVGGKVAARKVRESLAEMAQDEALDGVEGGVLDYMKTHKEYRGMKNLWHPDRLVGKLTKKSAFGEGEELAVSPDRAAETVFGGRASGFLSKPGSVQAVDDLRTRLTPDEWIPVRNELELRLIGGGRKPKAGSQSHSPEMMEQNFNEAIRTHGEDFIMSILDDGTGNGAEQLAHYKRFFKIGRIMTKPPGSASRASSDTAPTMLNRFADSKFKSPVPMTGTLLDSLRTASKGMDNTAASQAQERTMQSMMDPNSFYAPPQDPMALGILSQLREHPQEYLWGQEEQP